MCHVEVLPLAIRRQMSPLHLTKSKYSTRSVPPTNRFWTSRSFACHPWSVSSLQLHTVSTQLAVSSYHGDVALWCHGGAAPQMLKRSLEHLKAGSFVLIDPASVVP